eukprot:655836-Amphidinium_carterae.1
MSGTGSGTGTTGWKDRDRVDPPPTWDGESPELRWRSIRRSLVLWSEDTEVPKARQGLRLYRSLQGKAATMGELMTDDSIRDFDRALYSGRYLNVPAVCDIQEEGMDDKPRALVML